MTAAGLGYTFAMLLIGFVAFSSGNNLLFLVLSAMIAIFFVSSFISRMGLAGLELDLILPEHISARRKIRAGIRLKNLKTWFPSFSIQLSGAAESGFHSILYFPVLPGGASIEEPVDLQFAQRGTQKERTFRFSSRFPFGFTERREMVTARHEILIYPCLDPQPGFEDLLASVAGDLAAIHRGRGSDFYRIRPYEAMESARHVDWKASAHTSALQVREFASEQEQRVEIYLDLDVSHEYNAWFESAVDAVAFLAYRLANRGTLIRFKTQEAEVTLPETGDVYSILRYLATVVAIPGAASVSPRATNSIQIIFTANPGRLTAERWGRILSPLNWPG